MDSAEEPSYDAARWGSEMKGLLLTSFAAASLVVLSEARAGDLPGKPRPAEYVRTCAQDGDGFYYIPGTDTCIRIGGYARVDYGWNANSVQVPQTVGTAGAQDRTVSSFQTRHRALLQMNTRTPTQFGTLRAEGRFYASNQGRSDTLNVTR